MRTLVVILASLGVACVCQARIITVDDDGPPADFNNIQAAIDDANDGDTVLVADGTYTGPGNRDIDFFGKAITVRSENGPNNCIIDCNSTEIDDHRIDCNSTEIDHHRGFYFHCSEDANSVLDGFTITNGYAGDGGGIYCRISSPTIANCVLSSNSASWGGGGLYSGSPLTLINCTFSGNFAAAYGGGIFLSADLALTKCTFVGNSAERGGGMACAGGSPTLTNCTFRGNSASWYGGGMDNDVAFPRLTNCIFNGNSAEKGGGAMFSYECWRRGMALTNCTFSGNSTQENGGGMYNEDSDPILINCTFSGNWANGSRGGGAIYNSYSPLSLTNCIFSGNSALENGGGMYNRWSNSLLLINCIFSGNSAQDGGGMYNLHSELTLTNCILWGDSPEEIQNYESLAGIKYSDVGGSWPGEGNIDLDPCFADPGHWTDANDPNIIVEPNDPNAVWINGDYHLKSQAGRWDANEGRWTKDEVTSPCIDAGDMASPIGFEPFPNGGIINMGAYGGTAEASKSYFGKPPCEIIVAGDVNGDCEVNFLDFRLMALHWLENNNP